MLWLVVYCEYFVVNLHISDASAALAMFLIFYIRTCNGCYGEGDTERACCLCKVFSGDGQQVRFFLVVSLYHVYVLL